MKVFLLSLCCFLSRFRVLQYNSFDLDFHETRDAFAVSGLPLSPEIPKDFHLGYAGLIPVRQGKGQIFFWYFEPQKKPSEESPLLIWLQGGPGASSMIGLFNLHGPLRINEKFKVAPANFSFNEEHAILYIDQPVGTGYSYVDEFQENMHNNRPDCFDQYGYVIDQCGVGLDLMEFLVKFGTIFPEAHTRPMYLLGESYAGKYLPTLASYIQDHNKASGTRDQFDLRGFAIGDGLTDPETQIRHYGKLALSFGLANPTQANAIDEFAEKAIASAQEGRWVQASSYRNDLFNYYRNITNNVDYYDIRNGDLPHQWKHMEMFLNQDNVKNSIHFPSEKSFFRDPKVLSSMQGDIMRSVVHLFPKFKGLKMMFFQGQFDYRDGPMSQFDWLYHTFPCLKEAQAKIWEVDGHTAGYRTACYSEEVSQVTVLQAGHMVSLTQPSRGLDLINWFIKANIKS